MRDLSIFNASVKAGKMQVIEVDLRFGWPTYVRSIPFWESTLLGQCSASARLGYLRGKSKGLGYALLVLKDFRFYFPFFS